MYLRELTGAIVIRRLSVEVADEQPVNDILNDATNEGNHKNDGHACTEEQGNSQLEQNSRVPPVNCKLRTSM